MRFLRVASTLLGISARVALSYRANLAFELATGMLRNLVRVAPLLVLFEARPVIAGMTATDGWLVMGLFLVTLGIQGAFFEPNLGAAVEAIRQGTLDLWLLLPADAQLLVSLRRVDPTGLVDVPTGLAIVGAVAWRVGASGADLAAAALLFGCGLVGLYAVWLLAICASFWFVRVDNLRFLIFSTADAGRWPAEAFHPGVRWLLTWVLPIFVATSWPAAALHGSWDATRLGQGVFAAGLLAVVSRRVWVVALRSYTSASS